MPFMTLNGVTVPVAADSFVDVYERTSPISVRSAGGVRLDSMQRNPATWSARTTIRSRDEINALRRLVDGHGHIWGFNDSSSLSSTGLAEDVGSVFTLNASGGKFGGRCTVSSGQAFYAALGERMFDRPWTSSRGWTIACFKKLAAGDGGDGSTYFHHVATGAVTVTRGASANPASVTQYRNGAAGSFSMGNWISVTTDGRIGIHGYSNANATAAYDYDELLVLPFVLPSTWAAGLYAFHNANAWPSIPRLRLGGDCVVTPVDVVGQSGAVAQHNVRLGGVHTSTARSLAFDLFEV